MTGKFEPKTPVELAPPKTDPISLEALAEANGMLCFHSTDFRRWDVRCWISGGVVIVSILVVGV